MPDYAKVYRHGLRATDPTTRREVTGTLDPESRYNLEFTSQQIPPGAVMPSDIAEATESRQAELERATRIPEWTEFTDIDDLPEQDYNLGRLTIKRQYTDDVKIANQYDPGSPEYTTFHQEAAATMNARMGKLNVERDRAEMAFRQTNQDPNLGREEKSRMKTDFYGRNPVWKPPRVEYPEEPKPLKIPSRGKPSAPSRLDDMADRATELAVGLESPLPFRGTSKVDILKAVKRAADMAGWGDLNEATKEALLETLDMKMKNTRETRGNWDEETLNAIREYIGLSKGGHPSKPAEYPDAEWSEEHQMWTVVRNGRLKGIQ